MITYKSNRSASEISSVLNVQSGMVHVINIMPCCQLLHEANSSMHVCFNGNDVTVLQDEIHYKHTKEYKRKTEHDTRH